MIASRGTPQVFVVVLNWNGLNDTLRCLESLAAAKVPSASVIVVDNGSRDDPVVQISRRFPEVTVLANVTNEGFAGGCNQGIAVALERGAAYVLLLNNDTTVAPDFLDHLVQAAETHRRAGMLGPKILFHDRPDRIWFAGNKTNYSFGRSLALGHRGWNEVDRGQYDKIESVGFLTGCAVLIRRELIADVGAFDPDFFAYFEDGDLCLRALAAGYQLLFVPRARVWHRAATSGGDNSSYSPLTVYLTVRNRLLFMRKHGRWWGWFVFVPAFGAVVARLLWRFRSRPRKEVVRAIWLGIADYARGHVGRGSVPLFAGER
jgi:GT2 family glycosyltransferase